MTLNLENHTVYSLSFLKKSEHIPLLSSSIYWSSSVQFYMETAAFSWWNKSQPVVIFIQPTLEALGSWVGASSIMPNSMFYSQVEECIGLLCFSKFNTLKPVPYHIFVVDDFILMWWEWMKYKAVENLLTVVLWSYIPYLKHHCCK